MSRYSFTISRKRLPRAVNICRFACKKFHTGKTRNTKEVMAGFIGAAPSRSYSPEREANTLLPGTDYFGVCSSIWYFNLKIPRSRASGTAKAACHALAVPVQHRPELFP